MNHDELVALTREYAGKFGLDPAIVCGIVHRESSWNTYALRSESESGFARRYGAEYARIVKASATKHDDYWFRFEDIFYSSYGLMQAMYPCVVESFRDLAARLAFPTELCDPRLGLEAGCRIFQLKMKAAGGDVRKALLYFNGGANKHYPDEVLALSEKYKPLSKAAGN